MNKEDAKVGAKVFVTGADRYINREAMSQFINNGVEYEIRIGVNHEGLVELTNNWWYDPSSLTLADNNKKIVKVKKVVIKKKKAAPKPKVFKSLRHKLHNAIKSKGTNMLCSFLMADKDEERLYLNMPCHAALGYDEFDYLITTLIYGLSFDERKVSSSNKEAYKQYVEYILNESPWRHCFITKKYSTGIKMELLMDVSKTRHEIAGACIALRSGMEFQDNLLQMFKEIVDKGYSGHTAMLLGFMFYRKAKDTLASNGFGGGHMPLHKSMNAPTLITFFKKGYVIDKKEKTFSEEQRHYSVHNTISKTEGVGIQDFVYKKGSIKLAGWGAATKITNDQLQIAIDSLEQSFKEVK